MRACVREGEESTRWRQRWEGAALPLYIKHTSEAESCTDGWIDFGSFAAIFFSTKTSNRVVFDPYSISELKPTEPRRHSDDRARTPIKGTRSPPVVIDFDSFRAFRSIDFESFPVISNKQLLRL